MLWFWTSASQSSLSEWKYSLLESLPTKNSWIACSVVREDKNQWIPLRKEILEISRSKVLPIKLKNYNKLQSILTYLLHQMSNQTVCAVWPDFSTNVYIEDVYVSPWLFSWTKKVIYIYIPLSSICTKLFGLSKIIQRLFIYILGCSVKNLPYKVFKKANYSFKNKLNLNYKYKTWIINNKKNSKTLQNLMFT